MKLPLIFGHRGSSKREPENTMRAFASAFNEGADGIEFDIRRTKDNKLVAIHDSIINRTSNSTGRVRKYTYSELLQFDFGKGEKIPLLREIIEKYGNKYWLNIEIKEHGLAKLLVTLLSELKIKDKIVVSSFKSRALKEISKLDSSIPLAYLYNYPRFNFTKLPSKNITSIHPERTFITKNLLTHAHKLNLKVRVWTVDNKEEAIKLTKIGVDGLITNDPQEIIAALQELKK
jgi:glycerophosphoryl diester phosphodiesterase